MSGSGVGAGEGRNAAVSRAAFDDNYPYHSTRRAQDVDYQAEYYDADGHLLWQDQYKGLVVTAGLNKDLDALLKTGIASPAWYIGLISGAGTPVVVAADTMASHAGWTEFTDYSESTRPAFTPGTITNGAVDNSASKAVFTFTADGVVWGTFMVDLDTKGNNTQTLYDAGIFNEGAHNIFTGGSLHVTLRPSTTAVLP
jgi:hypothetical protein